MNIGYRISDKRNTVIKETTTKLAVNNYDNCQNNHKEDDLNKKIKNLAEYSCEYEKSGKSLAEINKFIDRVTDLCKEHEGINALFNKNKGLNYPLTKLLKGTLFTNRGNEYEANRFVAIINEAIKSHVETTTNSLYNRGNKLDTDFICSILKSYKDVVSENFFKDLISLSIDNLLLQDIRNTPYDISHYFKELFNKDLIKEDILINIVGNLLNNKIKDITDLTGKNILLLIVDTLSVFKKKISDVNNIDELLLFNKLVMFQLNNVIESFIKKHDITLKYDLNNYGVYKQTINYIFNHSVDSDVIKKVFTKHQASIEEINIIKKMQQTSSIDTITIINKHILKTNRQLTPAYQKNYKEAINRIFLDKKTCGVVLTEILISYGNVLSEDSIIKKIQQTSSIDTITKINKHILKTNIQLSTAYQKNYVQAINCQR